jgi:hypothetical protein
MNLKVKTRSILWSGVMLLLLGTTRVDAGSTGLTLRIEKNACVGSRVMASRAPTVNVDDFTYELLQGSGTEELDSSLSVLAFDVVKAFEIPLTRLPVLLFLDEGAASPNSYQVPATPELTQAFARTEGAVVIGRRMLSELLEDDDAGLRGANLAGIIAHEFGHAYQRITKTNFGLNPKDASNPPVRLLELHADFLAGYYFAQRGGNSNKAVIDFANALSRLGDDGYNAQDAHGTSKERLSAMYKGLTIGQMGILLADASKQGEQFVKSLGGTTN